MSVNKRVVRATPEDVFKILSDGWLYPLWVVGATSMREVDEDFPAAGSKLYHSVGTWPAMINDSTQILEIDPGRRLVLQARAWPGGEARVEITVDPHPDGAEITIEEDATVGPGKWVPKPLRDAGLSVRNSEALKRLAYLCENRPS